MKKYLFDTNNFDKAKVPEGELPVYTESQMALARQQSIDSGREAGLAEARQRQEEHIAATLDKILVAAMQLADKEEERDIQRMSDAVTLTMRITHKLLPQFAQKNALAEIESVILQSLESRKDEPRIAVAVHSTHMEAIKARIDGISREKSYSGKMIIVADDTLAETDCRVEWADGGTERLYARLFAQIETEFTKSIAGMKAAIDDINDKNA